MELSDIINAGFEGFGGIAVLMSCLRVMKDKQVHGVSMATVGFFTSWGAWNIYYYPSMGQTWSGIAACGVLGANVAWCLLLFKYRTKVSAA